MRVSWIAAWKGRIAGGRVSSEPVIQLDVLPTALAAAKVASASAEDAAPSAREISAKAEATLLDGANLLPLLEGKTGKLAPRALFFRFGVQYAVREGGWKLVKASKDMTPVLVNLATDRGEQTDLTAREPEKAKALQTRFDKWNATMQPPRWEDQRWNGDPQRKATQRTKKKKERMKLALALIPLLASALPAHAAQRPNVVLVMADDQGWGDTSCHGHPVLKTPNLDAMAASGLRMNRFHTAHFNCSPTRARVRLKAGGIRVHGAGHVVKGNTIERTGAFAIALPAGNSTMTKRSRTRRRWAWSSAPVRCRESRRNPRCRSF